MLLPLPMRSVEQICAWAGKQVAFVLVLPMYLQARSLATQCKPPTQRVSAVSTFRPGADTLEPSPSCSTAGSCCKETKLWEQWLEPVIRSVKIHIKLLFLLFGHRRWGREQTEIKRNVHLLKLHYLSQTMEWVICSVLCQIWKPSRCCSTLLLRSVQQSPFFLISFVISNFKGMHYATEMRSESNFGDINAALYLCTSYVDFVLNDSTYIQCCHTWVTSKTALCKQQSAHTQLSLVSLHLQTPLFDL